MKKTVSFIIVAVASLVIISCDKNIKTDTASGKTASAGNGKGETVTGKDITGGISGNSVKESGITDIDNHTGNFIITFSQYKGELFIGISEGKFYGTIKFFNWGNGVPQPLTDLKVTEKKIYFRRVINRKEDLLKYGGTAFFDQQFYGIFTEDKKTIKGYYRLTGTQDNWKAVKK